VLIAKDGKEIPIADSGAPIKDEKDNIIGVVVVFRDITERKKMEEKLRKSEELFRDFFDSAAIGFHIFGPDRVIIEMNEYELNMLGYSREEIVDKKTWDDFVIPGQRNQFEKQWNDILDKGQVNNLEYTLIHKDGHFIDVLLNASSRFDDNNNLINARGSVIDITRRRKAEQALRESEHNLGERVKELTCLYKLSKLVENSDISYEEILQGTLGLIPPAWQFPEVTCARIVYEDKELRTENYLESKWKQKSNIILKGEIIGLLEVNYVKEMPNFDEGPFLKEERNLINGITEILGRFAKRRKAEQKLKDEKEKAQTYLEIAGTILLVLNPDQTVQLINQKGCEILEEYESEILGINWIDNYIPENSRELVKREYNRFVNGEIELFEYTEEPIIKKNGEKRIIAWHNRALKNAEGKVIGSLSSGQDITERRKIEKKLMESEEKLKNFMDAATEGFLIYDSELNLLEINDSALNIIRMSREDMVGKHILELIPDLDKTGRYDTYLNVIKTGEPFYDDNVIQIPKFGGIHLSINAFKIIGGLGMIFNDVTERRIAEQKLKESEKNYRSLFENMTSAFAYHKIIVDEDNKPIDYEFLEANPAFEEFTGLKAENIIGKTVKEILPGIENDPGDWIGKYGKVALTGIPVTFENYAEPLDQWYSVSAYSPKKDHFAVIFINITEQKQVEEAIKKSETKYREAYNRAEFYKDLFTHDINNILQNILSGIQLSEIKIGDSEKLEKLEEYFSIIKDQLKRGAKLVSNIRKLSKLEEAEISIKKVEICSILEKSIAYMKNAYTDKNMTIQVDSIDKKLYVHANELLEDVFENILVNAIKYCDNLTVEILVKISKEKIENKNYIRFEFMDNGIGIDDSRKDLVFQRGYSDEKSAQGMGLGLSLVKKIIDNYKGKIWVEDRVKRNYKKGSNFVILIPEVL
jgi:PAS domain S-box-containing protein